MKQLMTLTTSKNWWQGEVKFNYNLRAWMKILAMIIAIPFAVVGLAGYGLWHLFVWCWQRLKKMFSRPGADLSQAAEKPETASAPADEPAGQPQKPSKFWKNNWWPVGWIILVLLLILGWWKSCSSLEPKPEPTPVATVYETAFDKVVVARAYLDGVQSEVNGKCPRALVGFKFINGKPVKDFNFEGMTYDQAVKVVAEDWRPVVVDNLNPGVELNEQQMAVVTLTAMRMGKYGFARSTFLEKVNQGKLNEAGEWLLLQKPDGSVRKTGSEPKQYFYILRLLWNGELTINELLDYPMFSYKGLGMQIVEPADGEYRFTKEVEDLLLKGNYPTPREALELEL